MTLSIVVAAAAEEGAQGGLGGPFVLEPGLIVWTWVVFILLFLLLKKYAWPPIVRLTEERERRIAGQLEEAERLSAEAKATLEEHRKVLAGAKEEAHAVISEARAFAQKDREQLLHKAEQERQLVLERVKREIEAERERAVAELRREAVDLSLAAAAKLIEQRLDSEADRKIVERFITSLGGKPQ